MFPIRFDFPFRKANGDLSTIGAEISAGGGGGGGYTLPTASAETKGGIKIGAGLSVDGEVLNNSNPTAYTLPTASAETKGGIKVGTGLSIDENGVLSASGGGGGGIPTSILPPEHLSSNPLTLEHDAIVTVYSTSPSASYLYVDENTPNEKNIAIGTGSNAFPACTFFLKQGQTIKFSGYGSLTYLT